MSRNSGGMQGRLIDLLKSAILGDAAGAAPECADSVFRAAEEHGVSALIYSAFAAKKKTPPLSIFVPPAKRP